MHAQLAALATLLVMCSPALAEDITVHREHAADYKAVFATVEPRETVPARVRTGGTIARVAVRRGEAVKRGQLLATVGDPKLVLQRTALDSEMSALHAQLGQTEADLARQEWLAKTGETPRALRDQTRTQVQVQRNMVQAKTAQLGIISQQMTEGDVLAPTDGRVVDLPYTVGTVVAPGESIADIAVAGYVLRMRLPEEHAAFIKVGDPVRLDDSELGGDSSSTGIISLLYPKIEDGRVVADAVVPGLGDFYVGRRVRAWVAGAPRERIVIPQHAITTRFGLDYVHVRAGKDVVEIPIQHGEPARTSTLPDGIEILSGLSDGDVLVVP